MRYGIQERFLSRTITLKLEETKEASLKRWTGKSMLGQSEQHV